ncbi:pyridoxal phosphate enzyme, YggS family [Catonella morbi ATCC 51271]|jgi:pyridoxal phosphate enzyme, yggS family|uniref:Pyridoxal phosphate homeostasis protein n=1 Tax=Catonella morbi ATCC 51271 TaxID=592026 RepID=V2ZCR7_9FIRM|nr:YggS family pyridoxal phosphate-dependent enzyme [Catonella morbi]ESL04720.1 pyridoxal phosphate enzyme, YggS family [Catonella morbi ATCC 51271]
MSITENLSMVENKIAAACKRAGRERDEVKLIAVSKTQPVEAIREAIEYGINSFGENRVQELREKTEIIKDNLDWHLIGHLQTNKVKYVVGKVSLIHSLENIRLAEALDKEAAKLGITVDVLAEINVAKEASKFGVNPEDAENFIREVSKFPNINIKGLMTVAPYTDISEENRKYFRQLKKIMVDLNSKNIHNVSMNVLSMGMTGDYEVAIEEGATLVRVGTGIFGSRNYDI